MAEDKSVADVTKAVESLDVGDEALPDDLRELIEETVEDKAKQDEKKKEITVGMLVQFFKYASDSLSGGALSEKINENLKKGENGEELAGQAKLQVIKKTIEAEYISIWEEKLTVNHELGREAMTTITQLLNSDKINQEEKAELKDALTTFGQAEHRMVGVNLLGKEEYDKRQEEKEAVAQVQKEIIEKLDSLDPAKKGKYILNIKKKGEAFRKKMMEMGQEKALDYMDNLSEEDEYLLRQLSALSSIMQSQSHGHSHNGQPCSGHGHANHGQSHGHSHEQSHGHSHDGKPCGGHGHSH